MKFFIWDFDGTLYDSYPMILSAVMNVLKKNQVQANRRAVYKMLKEFSSKKVAETYDIDFALFTEDLHHFEAADQREPQPYEGVVETLARIKAGGGRQFIMTHRIATDTERLLANHGLVDYFEEIVGPERKFARKPDPEALNYLIAKYQMPQSETVMIGDRIMDVVAGNRAGIASCFFDNEGLLENVPADFICQQPTEIVDLLSK
ncbi:HAD-IA family hydrolase [Enterococcus asini]|uniref:HAD-IA family hydrolase n=1 Tax=Enterococcus asini TaxID=57732 RepID=UPI0028915B21|nr:HAD-IA family hydrolase [Enterococcus asini]MDT2757052.1 HAD-IA family hydrolase [Enterococcus asini]